MNDSITDCIVSKNPDGSIVGYQITFSFSNLQNTVYSPAYVYVSNSEVSNSSDLNEVKKIALQKAAYLKKQSTFESLIVQETISDLNGPVIL